MQYSSMMGLAMIAAGAVALGSAGQPRQPVGIVVSSEEASQIYGADDDCKRKGADTYMICSNTCGKNEENFTEASANGYKPDYENPNECGTGNCAKEYGHTEGDDCGT